MHDDCNMVELQGIFFWFNVILWLQALLHLLSIFNLQQILIEFFAEALNSMLVTFLITEFLIGTQIVLIFLSFFDLILMLQDICMKVIESCASWFASVVTCCLQRLSWTKSPLLLLLLFHSLQVLGSDFLLTSSIKTIMCWLVAPIIHHVDKLDRKTIELRLWLQLFQFLVYGLLFLFEMFQTFVFEESLLVIQKFIEVTLVHIIVWPF